jgi:hypothetical protein
VNSFIPRRVQHGEQRVMLSEKNGNRVLQWFRTAGDIDPESAAAGGDGVAIHELLLGHLDCVDEGAIPAAQITKDQAMIKVRDAEVQAGKISSLGDGEIGSFAPADRDRSARMNARYD